MGCDNTLSLCVSGLISSFAALVYCFKLHLQLDKLKNDKKFQS